LLSSSNTRLLLLPLSDFLRFVGAPGQINDDDDDDDDTTSPCDFGVNASSRYGCGDENDDEADDEIETGDDGAGAGAFTDDGDT
jgi:hypothetical protein